MVESTSQRNWNRRSNETGAVQGSNPFCQFQPAELLDEPMNRSIRTKFPLSLKDLLTINGSGF